jgi:hypothetical protein
MALGLCEIVQKINIFGYFSFSVGAAGVRRHTQAWT